MSTPPADASPDTVVGTDAVRVSDPFPYGWRGEGPVVRTLGFPTGTQRIWRRPGGRGLVLRDIADAGLADGRPAGWLTPDDQIILEEYTQASAAEIAYLHRYFTGANRHIDNIADMDPASQAGAGAQGRCIHCHNIDGKPHLRTCPHHGKTVGDPVR